VVASATYVTANRTVIIKVVNAGPASVDTAINIHGVSQIEPQGTAIVLAGEPDAVNTLDEPTKVSPKAEALGDAALSFHRVFPPYSLTLLRLKALAAQP
jgi:alpha-L-arabinofuranosidase